MLERGGIELVLAQLFGHERHDPAQPRDATRAWCVDSACCSAAAAATGPSLARANLVCSTAAPR